MIRPMTSNVCSPFGRRGKRSSGPTSGFPLPPLKFRTAGFPQYGFKRAVNCALRRPRAGFDAVTVAISARRVSSVVGLMSNRHVGLLTPHTRPVALGSASGCSVRQPLSLLWPHPSFWPSPSVSLLMPTVLRRPEVPQFNLSELDSVPPSLLRWLQDAERRACTPGTAFAFSVKARQPLSSTLRDTCGCLTKRQHSLNAAARNLASPRPGRDVYDRAFMRSITLAHVGYNYMNSRLIHDQTFAGCPDSLMGCTQRKLRHERGAKPVFSVFKNAQLNGGTKLPFIQL